VMRKSSNSKETLWERTRTYINNLEPGTIFTRRNLFDGVYGHSRFCRKETTVDHYRLYFTMLKYVDHVGHGKYKKVEQIPIQFTSENIKIVCYDKSWQSWFIDDIEQRIEVITNEHRLRKKARKKVP
jgi:hypothetical protein